MIGMGIVIIIIAIIAIIGVAIYLGIREDKAEENKTVDEEKKD